jgi:SAM-dependent methyltransferase
MEHNLWEELEKLIDDQLDLQVNISFDRHYSFMNENGLDRSHKVIDLGTGDGLFLEKVARKCPEKTFYGVDNQPVMIERANQRDTMNVKWIVGDINEPDTLPDLREIDGILMRYLALHLSHLEKNLRDLSASIRPSTNIWIFDVDLNHFTCNPPHHGFDLIRELLEKFCDVHSIDSKAGTKIPPLLKKTGFELITVEVEPFNNQVIELKLFKKFILQEAILYHHFLYNTCESEEISEISNFVNKIIDKDQRFIQYGMVMICGRKN